LKDLVSKVSLEHLEKNAEESFKNHQQVLRDHKENYLKTFLDRHREAEELKKLEAKRRADGIAALLAQEAREEQ